MTQARPLQLELADRACYRLYLLLAHLLPPIALLFTPLPLLYWSGSTLLVLASAAYWGWRESRQPHPQRLRWHETSGWALEFEQGPQAILQLRRLMMGRCLVLETRLASGVQILFLRPGADWPQLRRVLHMTRGGER